MIGEEQQVANLRIAIVWEPTQVRGAIIDHVADDLRIAWGGRDIEGTEDTIGVDVEPGWSRHPRAPTRRRH